MTAAPSPAATQTPGVGVDEAPAPGHTCRLNTVSCGFVGDRIVVPLTLTAACGWTHTAAEGTVPATVAVAQAAYEAHVCLPASTPVDTAVSAA